MLANTSRVGWILGESYKAMACCKRVGVRKGMGMDWAVQHGLVLVGDVCGGDDSDWWIPGPVNGFEWRRKHNAVDRRTEAKNLDFPSLAAVATTLGTVSAGESAGRKSRGKKARERLRRRIEARRGDRSSARRPERAHASSSSIKDQQGGQQRTSSTIAAGAPSSAGAAAAEGEGAVSFLVC